MSYFHNILKRAALGVVCVAGLLGSVEIASAEDANVLLPQGARATIVVNKVDDSIVCDVGGAPVVGTRSTLSVRTDITNFLRHGSNVLRCRVYDNDGGTCYGYDFKVIGTEPEITRSFHCCNNSTCARPNPVLEETYTIVVGGRP